jgi:hypothetical protein
MRQFPGQERDRPTSFLVFISDTKGFKGLENLLRKVLNLFSNNAAVFRDPTWKRA